MKRLFTIMTALILALAMVAPAGAKKKPPKPGPPDPPAGLTCEESGYQNWDFIALGSTGFTITLNESSPEACYDVMAYAGDWNITVDLGSARQASFSLKDSVPGDWCVERTTTKTSASFIESVPESTLDACGTEFSDSNNAFAFQADYRDRGRGATVTITVTLPSAG